MHILVTGASGFVGGNIIQSLKDYKITAVGRSPIKSVHRNLCMNLDGATDYSEVLSGVDCVVHCAARIKNNGVKRCDELDRFRQDNVDVTTNLAQQAAKAGVKRFIFLSSAKVNGEVTPNGVKFLTSDRAAPQDCYGQTKYEAECALKKIGEETDLDVVIIRPPLVYGYGVKGNMKTLVSLVSKGVPLPLGRADSPRSLVYIENLVSLVRVVIENPKAAGGTFFVSDDHDISTSDMVSLIALTMERNPRLLPVHPRLMRLILNLLVGVRITSRLFDSLRLDINQTKDVLGWEPQVSVEVGFERMIKGSRI